MRNEKRIETTKLENIALKRLKDMLIKNNITIADFSVEQIRSKYKTFRDSERSDKELELILSQYFNVPIELLRNSKNSHFDVPENYKGRKLGYIRVSSDKELERQDTARQRRELDALGVEKIYEDYASGTKAHRIEYNNMLRDAKTKDTIYCTEISRLSRSSLDLINLLEFIKEHKMCLNAGSLVFDCREGSADAMTEGMVKMMSIFAEIERNLISQRTRSGIENARASGKVLGRPAVTVEELPESFVKYYKMYRDQKKTGYKITQQSLADLCKCGNRDTMRRYINIAKEFEEKHGELLENFHERIKDENELKKWREEQILKSPFDFIEE